MAINFKLLRSSTASKRPTAANLDTGELALNFNDDSGGLFYENASGGVVKVGPAQVSSTAPNASPGVGGSTGNSLGEFWYDTGNTSLKIWDGGSWEVANSSTTTGISTAATGTAITLDSSNNTTVEGTLTVDSTSTFSGDVTFSTAQDVKIIDNSGLALRVMEGTTEYMRFTTTDGGEKIQTTKELEVNGALNIDGAVDCAGDITFSDAQSVRLTDNLGFALRMMEGSTEYMRVSTLDGVEQFEFSKPVVCENTLVVSQAGGIFVDGSVDVALPAANSNALDFAINGGNQLMRFNTNTETVYLQQNFEVDGTSQFDGVVDINSTVDISGGEVTFSANVDIQLVDNSGQALDIAEGANNYLRFITLDGAEEIEVYKDLELKAENISMTGAAGVDLTLIDNFGSALTIKDAGGLTYQSFNTSNAGPQVQFLEDVLILTGKSLTLDNVEIASVQTGSETFVDNDTSIMTSAAIKDLVDTVSGVTQTEGTFTATFRGSTAEPGTLVTTTGYYVQIGKMVTVTIDTGAVSWTGYGGVATVTGMPATSKSGYDFVGSFHSSGGLFEPSNNDGMVAHMDGNTTTLDLRAQDTATLPTWSPAGIDTIMFTITYFTA